MRRLVKPEQIRRNAPKYNDWIPKGKNKMSLKQRFAEFDNYENSVPTGENYGPNLANLRDPLRVLYGKVDFHGMPVKPKKEYLKEIFNPVSDETFFALDFVADLFKEMLLYIDKAKDSSTFSSDSIYAEPYPAKAWVDIDSLYEDYISKFNNKVISSIAGNADIEKALINYDKFEKYYVSKAIRSANNGKPYTKTEFALSTYCDRTYTGLSIDITDIANCGNDEEKYLVFVRDINFPNIRQIAGRFGFRVDFNTPWRFHCDLNSPVVQQKLMLRGVNSFDEFFKRFYDTIHVEFIDYFKDTLLIMYNYFTENYDSYEKLYLCPRSGDIKSKIYPRYPVDLYAVDRKPKSHWYRQYLMVRAAERGKKFSKYDIDKMVRKAADYDLARGGSTGEDMIEMYFIDRLDELFKDRLTMKKMSGMIEDTNNYGQY